MEISQREYVNHDFSRKVLILTDHHCQFLCVCHADLSEPMLSFTSIQSTVSTRRNADCLLKYTPTKYIGKQNLDHFDDVSVRDVLLDSECLKIIFVSSHLPKTKYVYLV